MGLGREGGKLVVQLGREGSWADRTHDDKERKGGKEPFYVPSKTAPKKSKINVQSRRMADNLKGEEVRKHMRCRRVGG